MMRAMLLRPIATTTWRCDHLVLIMISACSMLDTIKSRMPRPRQAWFTNHAVPEATRHVLAWRLSNTMDAAFCVEALKDALARYGRPEIFNTDQGSQFTSFAFTGALKGAEITISMDGRGRCMDNIFIERLWRSLKYEAVYLHELTDGFKAERVIGEWIDFYNTERPHSALAGRTPAEAYGAGRPVDMMDKPDGLPTSPPAQQPRQDVINRILAA